VKEIPELRAPTWRFFLADGALVLVKAVSEVFAIAGLRIQELIGAPC
jgi:hypothetical protein